MPNTLPLFGVLTPISASSLTKSLYHTPSLVELRLHLLVEFASQTTCDPPRPRPHVRLAPPGVAPEP
eukprot:444906-Prymnesium_polylepis.1